MIVEIEEKSRTPTCFNFNVDYDDVSIHGQEFFL